MLVFAGEARYHIGIWYRITAGVSYGDVFIASFVCNLLYLYRCFDIVRLRSSGFGCYLFGVYFGCLMFADDIMLFAHTVSAID